MTDRATAEDCNFYVNGRCILRHNCGTVNCTFVENTDSSMEAEAVIRAEITRLESLISAPRECPTSPDGKHRIPEGDELFDFCPRCGTPLSAPKESE